MSDEKRQFDDDLISGLLDGELSVEQQEEVERWLDADAGRRQEYEELLSLRETLKSLPTEKLNDEFTHRVVAQAQAERQAGNHGNRSQGRHFGSIRPLENTPTSSRRWLAIVVALAASIVLWATIDMSRLRNPQLAASKQMTDDDHAASSGAVPETSIQDETVEDRYLYRKANVAKRGDYVTNEVQDLELDDQEANVKDVAEVAGESMRILGVQSAIRETTTDEPDLVVFVSRRKSPQLESSFLRRYGDEFTPIDRVSELDGVRKNATDADRGGLVRGRSTRQKNKSESSPAVTVVPPPDDGSVLEERAMPDITSRDARERPANLAKNSEIVRLLKERKPVREFYYLEVEPENLAETLNQNNVAASETGSDPEGADHDQSIPGRYATRFEQLTLQQLQRLAETSPTEEPTSLPRQQAPTSQSSTQSESGAKMQEQLEASESDPADVPPPTFADQPDPADGNTSNKFIAESGDDSVVEGDSVQLPKQAVRRRATQFIAPLQQAPTNDESGPTQDAATESKKESGTRRSKRIQDTVEEEAINEQLDRKGDRQRLAELQKMFGQTSNAQIQLFAGKNIGAKKSKLRVLFVFDNDPVAPPVND